MDVRNSPASRVIRFGAFTVDLRLGQVHKHGLRLQVQEQPLQVLAMLLERPGDLVSRQELQQRLWPADAFVDFDHGLNAAINRLRECLADDAEKPRYIETIPRRGYRFIGSVEQDLEGPPSPAAAELPGPSVSSSKLPAWKARWPSAVMLAGLLCAAIALGWHVFDSRPQPPPIRSIAVLPLLNLSGDLAGVIVEQIMYFAKGMHEEAFEEDQKRLRISHQTERADGRERAHAKGGLHAVYQWDLERVKRVAAKERLGPVRFAAIYSVLGDRKLALHWLEEAFLKGDGEIVFIHIDPEFEGLHSDPHFKDLVRRIGLPN